LPLLLKRDLLFGSLKGHPLKGPDKVLLILTLLVTNLTTTIIQKRPTGTHKRPPRSGKKGVEAKASWDQTELDDTRTITYQPALHSGGAVLSVPDRCVSFRSSPGPDSGCAAHVSIR
ncbi:MAG: hypothetical protein ACK55Z_26735, partial [bacterium]